MSLSSEVPAKRNRWMEWQPQGQILADSTSSEPTKPSKPGSVGFDGSSSDESPEIESEPATTELIQARALLNRTGVRIMQFEGITTIGLWSDLDGPEIREALRTLGHERLSVLYLDGADVPIRYKLRQVQGEPVPLSVLAEMDRHPADPWKVRDRILREIGWFPKHCSWAQWKAATLNRLFQEQGVTGQRGRIRTAAML